MSNISSTQLIINKKIINQPITTLPIGASRESMLFFKEMVDLYSLNVTNFSAEDAFDRSQVDLQSVESLLFDRRVEFKVLISKIAMHLENGVRSRLFSQIDSLLDAKEWDEQDIPPGRESLKTFLRLLLSLRPERLPGMSATGLGTIVASWYSEGDQLIIDCLPGDRLRWSAAITVEDGRDRAAGETSISRFSEVIGPYRPARWFAHGKK